MFEESRDELLGQIVQSIGTLSERIRVFQENQQKIIVAVNCLAAQGALGKHLEALGVENFVESVAAEHAPIDESKIDKRKLVTLIDKLSQDLVYLDDRVDRLEDLQKLLTLPERKIKFKYEI